VSDGDDGTFCFPNRVQLAAFSSSALVGFGTPTAPLVNFTPRGCRMKAATLTEERVAVQRITRHFRSLPCVTALDRRTHSDRRAHAERTHAETDSSYKPDRHRAAREKDSRHPR